METVSNSILYVCPVCSLPQSSMLFATNDTGLESFPGPCQTKEQMLCAAKEFRAVYSQQDQASRTKCPLSCLVEFNEVKVIQDATRSIGTKSDVYVFYRTTLVKTDTEYVLYDASTIVAAVGGSLGLFLGFSCWQCVSALPEAFHAVHEHCQRIFGVLGK